MTSRSDLRAAAEQALDALSNCSSEYGHRCNRCDSEIDEGGSVVAALRAALAAEQPQPVVGWHAVADWLRDNYQDYPTISELCDAMAAAAPPPPAPAEQPQPVARTCERKPCICARGTTECVWLRPAVVRPAPPPPAAEPNFDEWYEGAHWGNEDFRDGCRRAWKAALAASRAKP